jgi:cytoskeletal protein RodZ
MTTGEKLRQKREEKGLSLEKAAQETNIRAQFLRAIEEDNPGAMASPTQVKGFTRLYASFLGMDPRTLYDEPQIALEAASGEKEEGTPEPATPEGQSKDKKRLQSLFQKTSTPENANPRERFRDLIPDRKDPKRSTIAFKEIGEELRNHREALGLSLADVERLTKIREIYLYNLEQGEMDALPSTVQGRGILNNYATFLSIDPTTIQRKIADALQQKRLETAAVEITSFDGKTSKRAKTPITGWRRFLTIDLLVGGSVFIILMVLVIWGAIQVIGSTQPNTEPTLESISEFLIAPGTETVMVEQTTTLESPDLTAEPSQAVNTVSVDILATITSVNTGSIQLVVVGVQRTYLKVIADGKEVFNGRVVPGNVYTFTGSTKIILNAGSAAGIQVFYNQEDLGVLGMVGEVLMLEFTSRGYVTSTPMFTPSPTATLPPTLTQRPTTTPTITPTQPTRTITPLTVITTSQP